MILLTYAVYTVQLKRKVIALEDELAQVKEEQQSVAARAIQAVVCVLSYRIFQILMMPETVFLFVISNIGDGRGNQRLAVCT